MSCKDVILFKGISLSKPKVNVTTWIRNSESALEEAYHGFSKSTGNHCFATSAMHSGRSRTRKPVFN